MGSIRVEIGIEIGVRVRVKVRVKRRDEEFYFIATLCLFLCILIN